MAVRPMTAGLHLILIYQPSQAHGWPTELGQSAGLTIGLVEFAAPGVSGNLFRREGEYWTARYEGSVARLKDVRGLRCLARLLGSPAREFHAADLEAADSRAERPAPYVAVGGAGDLPVRPDLGDAGELVDARAKAAYRGRLDELEEAERFNDSGHAARASAERHFLVNELARGCRAGRPRPPSGITRRACQAQCDRGDPRGDGQARPRKPFPWPAARGHDPDMPVLLLHPDPRAPITWEP
jgi:hypothetical protein